MQHNQAMKRQFFESRTPFLFLGCFILLISMATCLMVSNSTEFQSQDKMINCIDYFDNGNFEWMWMTAGESGTVQSGTAEFYANKSMITWDTSGNIINYGSFIVTKKINSKWCYNYETYIYPEKQNICKTFTIEPVSESIIGCLNTDSCYETCETSTQWETWSAARLRYRLSKRIS
jgi:hypothetical protein